MKLTPIIAVRWAAYGAFGLTTSILCDLTIIDYRYWILLGCLTVVDITSHANAKQEN